MAEMTAMMPILSKKYCSLSETIFVVRRRPHVADGGGLVVSNFSSQKEVFRVDGCGVLGTKGELIVRDSDGDALLLIRRKAGVAMALRICRKWKGYAAEHYEGSENLLFSLKEPNFFSVRNCGIRMCTEPRITSDRDCDFEIKGYFPEKHCSIIDSRGNLAAQVGMVKQAEPLMKSKDVYHVVVKPGVDQAFVFGVISILDYIYGESTRC